MFEFQNLFSNFKNGQGHRNQRNKNCSTRIKRSGTERFNAGMAGDGTMRGKRKATKESGYKKGKSYYRGPYKKRKGGYKKYSKVTSVKVLKGAYPERYFCKLKATGQLPLTCASASSQYNDVEILASFNDLHDLTGGGADNNFSNVKSLEGFAALSQMYQKYTVIASKCKASFVNTATSASGNMIKAVLIPSTLDITEIQSVMDSGGSLQTGQYCALADDQFSKTVWLRQVGIQDANEQTIICYHKVKEFFPNKKVVENPELTGTTATDPSGEASPIETVNWFAGFTNFAASSQNVSVLCHAEVTYYVMFSDPNVNFK